jgi:hypothetical protein
MVVNKVEDRLGKFVSAAFEYDSARGQAHDSIRKPLCHFDLVKADYGGNVVFLAYAAQQAKHIRRRCGIQTGNGFIRQDDSRPLRQRARNSHSLLFSAAKLVHAFHGLMEQADALQTLDSKDALPLGQREQGPQGRVIAQPANEHIVQCGLAAKQLVLLEDHGRAPAVPPEQAAIL